MKSKASKSISYNFFGLDKFVGENSVDGQKSNFPMFVSRYVKKPISPIPDQLLNPQYHFMRMNYPEQCTILKTEVQEDFKKLKKDFGRLFLT